LASAATIIPQAQPRVVRLWQDTTRTEQLARLKSLELQPCDEPGQQVWKLAHEAWHNLPEGVRIDLPSARVFGRVLGLFRTGATLKSGKLLRLELSAQEIAELVGYSKATVEACLRWLGCETIEHQGIQVTRGLGLLHRGRRTAWAFLEGVRQRIYRTSRIVLTLLGRLTLGLAEHASQRKQRRTRPEKKPTDTLHTTHGETRFVQKHNDEGGDTNDRAAGRAWVRRINDALR